MVVEVRGEETVKRYRDVRFPRAEVLPDVPPRARSVGLYRDSKRAAQTSAEPVLLRAFSPAEASDGCVVVDIAEMTQLTGAACLLVGRGPVWRLAERVAVVENLECFLHFERLGATADVALYAGGRLSERVLDWLACGEMRDCRYVHCGDYDPVGLSEFVRLSKRVGDRVQLFLPPDLEHLLRTYGKRKLLEASAPVLANLRACGVEAVMRTVALLDETGCGLEQEALLLPGLCACLSPEVS